MSGESGAGKTESCKHVMRFYAVVGCAGELTGTEEKVRMWFLPCERVLQVHASIFSRGIVMGVNLCDKRKRE